MHFLVLFKLLYGPSIAKQCQLGSKTVHDFNTPHRQTNGNHIRTKTLWYCNKGNIMDIRVRKQVHARNQEGPMRGTFGSNKPAMTQAENMLNTLKNIDHKNIKRSEVQRGINTTKISVLEKQRTITPTSFVSVIPLQNYVEDRLFKF